MKQKLVPEKLRSRSQHDEDEDDETAATGADMQRGSDEKPSPNAAEKQEEFPRFIGYSASLSGSEPESG